jgi:hypothetical protein
MSNSNFRQFSDEEDFGNQKVNIAGGNKNNTEMQVTTKITIKKETTQEKNENNEKTSSYTEEISNSILSKLNSNLE